MPLVDKLVDPSLFTECIAAETDFTSTREKPIENQSLQFELGRLLENVKPAAGRNASVMPRT